jgi:hypothetical protein
VGLSEAPPGDRRRRQCDLHGFQRGDQHLQPRGGQPTTVFIEPCRQRLSCRPLGDFLYADNQIVDRPSNTLLATHLPASIFTGSSYGRASVPGNPAVTPDGRFIYGGVIYTSDSVLEIDRLNLTAMNVPIPCREGAEPSPIPGDTPAGRNLLSLGWSTPGGSRMEPAMARVGGWGAVRVCGPCPVPPRVETPGW